MKNITNYHYDDFNRLKEIEYPAATSGATRLKEKFEYDKIGRIKKVIDTANRNTVYAYDDNNQKITITDAELDTTELTYNDRFQVTQVKDARVPTTQAPTPQIYSFTYDPFGRTLSETRAGTTRTFQYDPVGNIHKRTDHSGRVTNYEYDQLNRLTKIKYGDTVTPGTPVLEATYGYDVLSNLTSATNESGTVTFGYDNRGRLDATTDVFGQAITYEYERTSSANQKRLKLNGSLYASYNYDDDNRLLNILNAADSTTISYTYYADDKPLTRTYPNGVSTTYLFDNMRRIKRLTDNGPSGTLFDREYAYNSANQISQIVEPSSTRIFGYDNADRLTSVTGSTTENYVYDKVGNRESSHLSSSYVNALFNRVTATQTATYGYDSNGNTTLKSEGKEFWRYSWDHENKLTTASTRKSSVRYKYDALGRRIQRIAGNGKENTKYTYEGDDVLLDNDDGTITKYLNGPGIDNKLRSTNGSSTSYFVSDHLGSTNGLTSSSGSLTASNSYDSFGNPTNSSFPTRYQFTGREFDSATGLQFSRARFYDPKLGKFLSEDPVGFAGGVNFYGYVGNNPQRFTDPMGLFPFLPFPSSYDPFPYRTGKEAADAWKAAVDAIRDAVGIDPPIGINPLNPRRLSTLSEAVSGLADPLRVGDGIGCAIYADGLQDFQRFDAVAADVVRGGGIFLTFAAPVGGRFAKPPVYPVDFLAGNAPWQVTPGIRTIEGRYVNDLGHIQPWRAHYDEFGRQIGRTDFNAGNAAAGIPPVHHVKYGYNNGVKFTIKNHIPGEYVP